MPASMWYAMTYDTINNVTETWEKIRHIDDFETVVGTALFQKFFYLEPDAKRIFGFPDSMDPLSDEVRKDKRFLRHAKYFVQMIDRALSLLGPEAEMLSEIFIELGGKHSRYGIKPEFFPSMGRALMESISNNLQDGEFTPAIKDDWIEVYHAMSFHMIRGHRIAVGEKV